MKNEMAPSPSIRFAKVFDIAGMLDIYNPIIRHSTTSFEYRPPTVEEFQGRVRRTLETKPWLVCDWDGKLAGYAYAGNHRGREAYQWSTELSAYVHPDFHRKGIATALYKTIIEIVCLQGYVNAYAGITLPNPKSVAFHESIGFKPIGVYHKVGYKHEQWHDVGWWELELQPHDTDPVPPVDLPEIMDSEAVQGALLKGSRLLANIQ